MTTDEGATRIRFPLLTARARIRPRGWTRAGRSLRFPAGPSSAPI